MYPEVSAERLYTISTLNRLISDCTCSPIQSAKELGKYHRDFCTLAHNLVKLNRIRVPEQGQYFLAGFKPILASTVHSQLEIKLIDHCPLDLYRVEDIYDAALYILQSQPSMPSISLPCDNALLSTHDPNALTSFQALPQAVWTFLLAPEQPLIGPVTPVNTMQGQADQQHAPLSLLLKCSKVKVGRQLSTQTSQ